MIIPFTYNILKRHPALMVMIHRPDAGNEYAGLCFACAMNAESINCSSPITFTRSPGNGYTYSSSICTDPFVSDETDPTSTRALESSLWELMSHRSHYHATVSTLCKIFTEPFTKPSYPLEDFLDHTYATVSSLLLKIQLQSRLIGQKKYILLFLFVVSRFLESG